MNYITELTDYIPYNEQEAWDKKIILDAYDEYGDKILDRTCYLAHMTASSMILNKTHDKVLMIYHNIYDSFSWTGGHADGDSDLLYVALKEANEETGIEHLDIIHQGPVAVDVIHVIPHIKRGRYVNAHLHMNLTYLFEGDETQEVRIKPDENKDVKWIPIKELDHYVSEKIMIPIYKKILREYI